MIETENLKLIPCGPAHLAMVLLAPRGHGGQGRDAPGRARLDPGPREARDEVRRGDGQDAPLEARQKGFYGRRGALNPVVEKVAGWREEGKNAALATVVKVERSGPLGPGTTMAISEDGQVVGSVSGGCVEPAVYEEAMMAIESGQPKLLSYGISDDEAFGVGLTCGGIIHIFVERVDW